MDEKSIINSDNNNVDGAPQPTGKQHRIAPNLFGPILSDIKQFIHDQQKQKHEKQQEEQISECIDEKHDGKDMNEICWNFVERFIHTINQKIEQEKHEKQQCDVQEKQEELISTQTLSDYKTGLELIVVWGIVPRLCR